MTNPHSDDHDELVEDVQATSADVAHDAEQLTAIEHQKKALAREEPAAANDLASEAEELARRILLKTKIEKQLTAELADQGEPV